MEALPVTKTCQHCGETFRRDRRQNSGWWARAKFCSERCMQAARAPQPIHCPSCGVEFTPKQGKSRPQRFCSISCANRGRGINPVTTRYARARSIDGKSKTMQRAMMETAAGKVLPPDVVVHHKDEDKLNNQFSNFETMTRVEHGRLHARLRSSAHPQRT
jgi:hypothetical protein